MKYLFRSFFLIHILLNSCKTDTNQSPVFAGEYDSNFYFQEYSPPLQVELVLDSTTNYYSGKDSIDFNSDGEYDILIIQHLQIPHLNNEPTQDLFPYCRLKAMNGTEIATSEVGYSVGHGYYNYISFVDSINPKTRIDNLQEWSISNKLRNMWFVPSPGSFIHNFGFWYEVANPEMYVGIRMKIGSDYKYGWINIDATSKENMRFISYAIEK